MGDRDPELEAVESALNTLALATSENALEKVVARLLPGLLTALATDSAAARKKCIEALQHINVRLRAAPNVPMPFDAVLVAASAPSSALMTRNVAIQGGYLGRCLDRHGSPGDAFKPLVIAATDVGANANGEALHALALRALEARVRATSSKSNSDAIFEELIREIRPDALASFLRYGQEAMRFRTKVAASQPQLLALVRLCVEFAGLQAPDRAALVFPVLLVAAGTTSLNNVSTAGEDGLKRIDAFDVLVEHDPSLVDTLFSIFLDSSAEIPLRSLVLSKGLLRATLSASCFPEVLQVVEESVYKPGVPDRLRALGMQFVSFVVVNGSEATLREHGVSLLRGMLKVIQDDTDGRPSFSPRVRGFAYTALAEILARIPSLFQQHFHFTPELFFTAAQSRNEPSEVRSSAAHALSTLAPVFSVESAPDHMAVLRDSLLATLNRTVANPDEIAASARAAAVLWANVCFPFDDPAARLICIVGAGDDRPDVCEASIAGLSPKRFRSSSLQASTKNEVESSGNSSGHENEMNPARTERTNSATAASSTGSTQSYDEMKLRKEADDVSFPDFASLVNLVTKRLEGGDGREPLRLRPNSWAQFFRFALSTLRRRAQVWAQKCSPSSWQRPDAWRGATPPTVAQYFEQDEDQRESFAELRSYSDRCILNDGVSGGIRPERAALCVVLFAAEIEPQVVASTYGKNIDPLLNLCTRKCASGGGALVDGLAKLIGIGSTALTSEDTASLIAKLGKVLEPDPTGRASGRHLEDERESAVLCLGQVVASLKGNDVKNSVVAAGAVGNIARRFQAAVESSTRVRSAACWALASVGVRKPLCLPSSLDEVPCGQSLPTRGVVFSGLAGILKSDKSDAKLVEAASNALGRLCVGEPSIPFKRIAIDALLDTVKLRKEDEVRFTAGESIVRATVNFDAPAPVSLRSEEDATEDEDLLALLYSGECVVEFRRPIDSGETVSASESEKQPQLSTELKDVMIQVTELCYSKRPHARTGACVFLVSFLRLVGSPHAASEKVNYRFRSNEDRAQFEQAQRDVLASLPQAHRAFMTLLGDRSDFAQQLAARGISLIYDMSTEEDKKELVSTLVRSLTSGKRGAATTVAGDEGGLLDINGMQLPNVSGGSSTGEAGSGAATYKELCSLATEMGNPELVYKFLDLAGHSALWSNRRGAALTGSALLSTDLAAEQLQPHMKTLLPRLYVYCYDPAEGVRLAMASVLRSVGTAGGFASVAAAVSAHYDAVVEHCLTSMTSSQWRVREAGTGALRDLLPSRRWNEVERHLDRFWYIGLRAMDDIKETVRTAAESLGRALSSLSVRLCDPNLSGRNTASAAADVVVPAILPAFTHGVKEVRTLASTTLSKIIRFGGDALRSSVPDIAASLLESATELEPQAMNYVQFHLDEDQRDTLETMRADAASMSSSPVIDSLERLAVLVDERIAPEVVSQLVRLARTGVGVPTRAATARFYHTLLSTRGVVLTPHAAKMMHAAVGAARMETSATARRSWSNAAGMGARLAPVESVSKLASTIVELSGAESAQDRALASYLALGLWQNSPETARKHATLILPIAYMGRYEADDGAKGAAANWRVVWSEGSPSSDAGLRLFAAEITDSCVLRLATSSQYKVKRSAAAALGAMAVALNSSTATDVGNASLAKAAKALVDALPGHIWDGKDAALSAIGTIASSASGTGEDFEERTRRIWSGVGGADVVVASLLKECVRGKREYRLSAMSALSLVLTGCRDQDDFVASVSNALSPEWMLNAVFGGENSGTPSSRSDMPDVAMSVWETGSDASAVDARNKARKAERAATIAAVGCLEASVPTEKCFTVQQLYVDSVCQTLSKLVEAEREVRTAALQHLEKLVRRLSTSLLDDRRIGSLTHAAMRGVADSRYSGVRGAGYALLLALVDRSSSERLCDAVTSEGRTSLQRSWSLDSSSSENCKKLRERVPALFE